MKAILSLVIILASAKFMNTAGCEREGSELVCKNVTLTKGQRINVNNLNNLQEIRFRDCTVPIISLGIFTPFKDVTTVDLDNSKINSIEPGGFTGLNNLETLYLNNNNISEITTASLNSLTSLKTLRLMYNRLSKVESNWFSNMNHLNYLDLDSNDLQYIDKNAFEGLVNLTTLDLRRNRLNYLPVGCFKDLVSLITLYLHSNVFTNFEYGVFTGLHVLKVITLNNNKLTFIQEGCFLPLNRLEELELSYNKIEHINANGLIGALPNLKKLFVNNNLWMCSSLFDSLVTFVKRGITLAGNDTTTETNILGIACKSEGNEGLTNNKDASSRLNYSEQNISHANFFKQFDKALSKLINDLQSLDESFANTTLYKFVNSDKMNAEFAKYFGAGFENSAFYKYFNDNFSSSEFFKYFNKTLRVDVESSLEQLKHYFDDEFRNSTFYTFFEDGSINSNSVSLKNHNGKSKNVNSSVNFVRSQDYSDHINKKVVEDTSQVLNLFICTFMVIIITILLIQMIVLVFICIRQYKYSPRVNKIDFAL